MPGLYGNTSTYTVTASNVVTLYFGSTSTAITATTYSTNLGGLYGGNYAPLPTNAEQLIQLFDTNGNVNFFLDPLTNSSTIYATFVGTASITLGNFLITGDSIIDEANNPINLTTNGLTWKFDDGGFLNLPASPTAQNISPPNGQLTDQYWVAPPNGQVNLANNSGTNYVWVDDHAVYIENGHELTPSSHWQFNQDGTTQFPNYTFPSNHGTAGQVLVDDGHGHLTWQAQQGGGGTGTNQVFDFGTILAPVSFTLDMGPIIV